ncbi:integrase catalytic domain-containing protein [Nephila pilipes]|uniref:Integrase catalytic domain-containing protein n=1 Tax=Nephila pilipes TaxID=299642 RepID=A0A8X6PKY5_NEPPI|nr:integrase catalytic domain-containing protein [Nephila pilipes]
MSALRTSSNLNASNLENTASALKLPKPRFSGDSGIFVELFNCFDNATGSNDSLTKIEKFLRLISLLSGHACNVVNGFKISEQNYDSCLNS